MLYWQQRTSPEERTAPQHVKLEPVGQMEQQLHHSSSSSHHEINTSRRVSTLPLLHSKQLCHSETVQQTHRFYHNNVNGREEGQYDYHMRENGVNHDGHRHSVSTGTVEYSNQSRDITAVANGGGSGGSGGGEESRDCFETLFGSSVRQNGDGLQCTHCREIFTSVLHLYEHNPIECRPFGCPICGKRFKHKNGCTQHIRQVHEGEKKHICPLCNRAFPRKSNMKRHLKSWVCQRQQTQSSSEDHLADRRSLEPSRNRKWREITDVDTGRTTVELVPEFKVESSASKRRRVLSTGSTKPEPIFPQRNGQGYGCGPQQKMYEVIPKLEYPSDLPTYFSGPSHSTSVSQHTRYSSDAMRNTFLSTTKPNLHRSIMTTKTASENEAILALNSMRTFDQKKRNFSSSPPPLSLPPSSSSLNTPPPPPPRPSSVSSCSCYCYHHGIASSLTHQGHVCRTYLGASRIEEMPIPLFERFVAFLDIKSILSLEMTSNVMLGTIKSESGKIWSTHFRTNFKSSETSKFFSSLNLKLMSQLDLRSHCLFWYSFRRRCYHSVFGNEDKSEDFYSQTYEDRIESKIGGIGWIHPRDTKQEFYLELQINLGNASRNLQTDFGEGLVQIYRPSASLSELDVRHLTSYELKTTYMGMVIPKQHRKHFLKPKRILCWQQNNSYPNPLATDIQSLIEIFKKKTGSVTEFNTDLLIKMRQCLMTIEQGEDEKEHSSSRHKIVLGGWNQIEETNENRDSKVCKWCSKEFGLLLSYYEKKQKSTAGDETGQKEEECHRAIVFRCLQCKLDQYYTQILKD